MFDVIALYYYIVGAIKLFTINYITPIAPWCVVVTIVAGFVLNVLYYYQSKKYSWLTLLLVVFYGGAGLALLSYGISSIVWPTSLWPLFFHSVMGAAFLHLNIHNYFYLRSVEDKREKLLGSAFLAVVFGCLLLLLLPVSITETSVYITAMLEVFRALMGVINVVLIFIWLFKN